MQIKLLLKQSLWFISHPGHFLTWGDPWTPCLASPPGIHLPLAFHWPYCLITDTIQWANLSFSPRTQLVGKTYASLWEHLDICPSLDQLHLASMTYPELPSLTSLRAWGDVEKSCSDMAYLLVSAEDEVMSDRVYGLSIVRVALFQARVSTVKEAVRQLTALVSSGPNWPYTLVWLNEGTHHTPHPKEGHLGILRKGDTNSAACGWVSQLEVCQLLSLGSEAIYHMGLNGHEVPMIASLPKLLARGTTLLGGKPTYLKVSIL